jgi:chromosome segregation ATPase
MKLSLVAALAASASASSSFTEDATVESSSSAANPIRKVVTLLKKMEQKVTAEGEKEAAMYKKYECYCKNAGSDLSKSISDSDAKIPEVASSIKEGEEQKVQLEQDLTKHRADREAAKAAMADATAIREKESAAFAKLDAEYTANIDAVTKAANAVDGGMSGGFLQTSAGSLLMRIVQSQQDMVDVDRQDVMAFFQGDESYGYAPQSGQISGILKGLADDMSKDRAEARDQEKGSVKVYGELMAAKTKEVQACTDAIESKTVRVGELAVSIVNMKNDLSDTQAALLEDQKFLGDLEGNCANRAKEYDVVVQTRSEELAALAEVIKLLQDDDALELFKKTLPSASSSFVQQTNSFASVQKSALATIRAAQKLSPHVHQQLDFITLALQGRKVSFDKVIKMIDEMTALLKEEQASDDNKKEYCSIQMDSMDDKKKGLERSSADSETAIESAKEDIGTLTSEIKALEEGIKNLDKSVMEASE